MRNFIQLNQIKIENKTYMLLLAAIIFLAYVIPVAVHQTPAGTDVYSHIFYSKVMLSSNSLKEFYTTCFEKGYLGYDYPFGIWLFCSLVSKITSLDIHTISYILPLLVVFLVIFMYFTYSGVVIHSKKQRFLSLIFLISMPNVSISLLNYETTMFVLPLLLFILYLVLNKDIKYRKLIPLLILSVFILCFTHTGTYLFLLSFSVVFLVIYGVLCRDFNKKIYLLVLTMLFIYAIVVDIFPHVHPQYIDKSRLVLMVGEFLSSKLQLNLAYDLSDLFYKRIFVDKSIIDIALWSGFIYGITKLVISISTRFSELVRRIMPQTPLFAIPILGEIKTVSHSLHATPFWIGPIHSFLSLIALFRLNKETLALLISILLVTILPASQVTAQTGAMREIFYLLLIVPITSAIGFFYLESRLKKFVDRKNSVMLVYSSLFIIFSSILVMPVIGNIYYKPSISGSEIEREGLGWLKGIGNSDEGCTGVGYRHMINSYADKEVPSSTTVHSGSELNYFSRNLQQIYFFDKSENYVKDLHSVFNIKYFISSNRVLRNLAGNKEELKIHENEELDKIYSNNDFRLYQYIVPEYKVSHINTTAGIRFYGNYTKIKDAGKDFLIETPTYKTRISKTSPMIKYLGNRKENFLGEGNFLDYIRISWRSIHYLNRSENYVFSEMNLSTSVQNNQILYKKILKDKNGENWATLMIRYVFYEDVIKNEILIANDWLPLGHLMDLNIFTRSVTPNNHFTYRDWYGIKNSKRIYPSEDYSKISDKKFSSIFLNDGNKGIYLKYDKTSQYPSDILYQGGLGYNYSLVEISTREFLSPAESIHITRYISIGDEKTAEENINKYLSVSIYPYPDGIIPLTLTGYLENLDEMEEDEVNHTLNTYNTLRDNGVIESYTEAISFRDEELNTSFIKKLSDYKVNVIGYGNLLYNTFYPLATQKDNVGKMNNNSKAYYKKDMRGFIPLGMKYNLDTIDASIGEDLLFIEGISVPTPFFEFYQEGFRHPVITYYHGNETSLMLLPVSEPTSPSIDSEEDMKDAVSAWKSAIDSAVKNDDLCILLWKSTQVGKPEYLDEISELIDYAKSRGMTFTTPEEIVKHYRLTQNISAIAFRDIDTVRISVTNDNYEKIDGLTLKVILPTLEFKCPYEAKNGRIARVKKEGFECTCYITIDVGGKETKTVVIEPKVQRKRFMIEIPRNPIEGEVKIQVKDENNNVVKGTLVTIENRIYETDENGILEVYLSRGMYKVKIEKAGFKTEVFNLEVKGAIYALLERIL